MKRVIIIAVNKLDKLYIITTFETIVSIYYYHDCYEYIKCIAMVCC